MLSESSYEAQPVHRVADPSKTVRQLRPDAGGGCLPPCLAVSEDPTRRPSWPGLFVHVGQLAGTHPCRALAAQAGLLSPKNFSAALEWTPLGSRKILHFCCPGIPPPVHIVHRTGSSVPLTAGSLVPVNISRILLERCCSQRPMLALQLFKMNVYLWNFSERRIWVRGILSRGNWWKPIK